MVACTVRSTASRTASGISWVIGRRLAMARECSISSPRCPRPRRPRMLNHHRGLWGYTGTANDGEPLSVQATGMGGPSAAIVVEELVALGARTLLRIGTCGALRDGFELGELVAAEKV